jgi:hypothetical protein
LERSVCVGFETFAKLQARIDQIVIIIRREQAGRFFEVLRDETPIIRLAFCYPERYPISRLMQMH